MIFAAEQLHLIRGGQVTQTRRPADPAVPTCTYVEGRSYAVQRSRKQPGEFRILIMQVRLAVLGDGTDDDARREGFKHATAAQRAWQKINGAWEAGLPVWVINFAVARDEIRLLRRKGGYTDKRHLALPDEPEAVDQVTLSAIVAGELHVEGQGGHLEVVRGTAVAPAPRKLSTTRPRGLHDMAEETLRARIRRHEGLDPDEVHAVDPAQGTPGDVRRRRLELGLRGVDGLPILSGIDADAALELLVSRGASVRDVALVMDWSFGKAQRYLAEQRGAIAA